MPEPRLQSVVKSGSKQQNLTGSWRFCSLYRLTSSREPTPSLFFFVESQGLPRAKVSSSTGLGNGQQVLSSHWIIGFTSNGPNPNRECPWDTHRAPERKMAAGL